MVIVCSTKDRKLWHITENGESTICGAKPIDMLTDVIELPENRKTYCPECLQGQSNSAAR